VKILITGGFGYIGSFLIEKFLQNKNYEIIVIDNLIYKNQPLNLPNIKHFNIDLRMINDYDKYLDGVEAIIHLAALVGDPVCAKNSELAKEINFAASIKLIEEAKKNKIPKFIFVSTCSNYGKMADSSKYIDETGELRPVSLYAQLKVEVEKYILQNQTVDFYPVILRFATAYGLNKHRMRFDLTVNEFTRDSVLKNELVIYGEQFWRPYCHIFDISEAIMKVLATESKKIAYEVFNVGATSENYTKQMIYELLKKENPELKVKFVKQIDDPRDYKVSFEKIKNVLNFIPKYKVIDGIREIIAALKANIFPDAYNKIYRNEIIV